MIVKLDAEKDVGRMSATLVGFNSNILAVYRQIGRFMMPRFARHDSCTQAAIRFRNRLFSWGAEMASVSIPLGLVDGRTVQKKKGESRLIGARFPAGRRNAYSVGFADGVKDTKTRLRGSGFVALFTGMLVGALTGVFYREVASLLLAMWN
jgi:hypothetical protein